MPGEALEISPSQPRPLSNMADIVRGMDEEHDLAPMDQTVCGQGDWRVRENSLLVWAAIMGGPEECLWAMHMSVVHRLDLKTVILSCDT